MIHSGDAQEGSPSEIGSVKLNVVDVNGLAISHAKIEMRSKVSGEDFSQRFSRYRAINIPYGKYLIRVFAPGSRVGSALKS